MAKKHRALILLLSLALFLSYRAAGAAPASAQTSQCRPDVNLDGEVNLFDLVVISRFYGSYASPGSQEDTNLDGKVDIFDLVCISINMRPCNCLSNQYDCPDFPSQAAAQACYEYCWRVLGYDIHVLDSDADGTACEYDLGSTPVLPIIPIVTPTLTRTPTPTPTRTPTRPASPVTVCPPSMPSGVIPAGVVEVTDGDTIDVVISGQTYTVRYIGIDTPETVHPDEPVEWMGKEASDANKALVEGRMIYLEADVQDRESGVTWAPRLLRYVWVDGMMVNAELLRLGYAQVSTVAPNVKYQDCFIQFQREAMAAHRGLWGSETPVSGACPYGCTERKLGCDVKGNISFGAGEKIYHVPGQKYYDSTTITPEYGERWFCTEAEAIANGWRKSME
jgi:micrococcal nuclease